MQKLHKNSQVCNPMQVAVILTMLCALVHASTAEGVPVEIKLGDGTVLSGHTLDTADFGCMEVFSVLDEQQSKQDTEPLEVQLEMISNEDMLARLRKCWDSDMTDSDQDMDADTFYRFIQASDYLLLQGDKYKQFARNMVRKGVLGKDSMAIVRQRLGTGHMGCLRKIAGQMLIALASECGCEVRVMKHDDHETEVTLCHVSDRKAESYGDICSMLETRPVIDRLSVRCNILPDRADRMEILTWLTDHLEVTLLWIGTELRMTKEDTQSIVKWSEGTTQTRLGLSLDLSAYEQPSHSFALALIPTIPALEELHIRGAVFEPSAAHIFGQCKQLKKLDLGGSRQTSPFVSALMPNLTSIRELEIWVGVLSTDAAEAFGQCKELEKLDLGRYESMQSSSFVSALMSSIPNIRELTIRVEDLSTDAAEAFRQCERLEKLYLYGFEQTSSFVSALMPNLTNIRELTIYVDELSPDTAEAFGQCKRLEKLHLGGSRQTSSFVSALMSNLTSIRELKIGVDKLSPGDAVAFSECERLEKLDLIILQNSAFIRALMPNLPDLKELAIFIFCHFSTDAAMAFRECKQLEKLTLNGYEQSSSFRH
jgi:BspA type Leucine rich repeat region (6 copies)